MDYQFSKHAKDMMEERNIQIQWVDLALTKPKTVENQADGTIHFIKKIREYGNRYLRVVVDPRVDPRKVITLFFDRRLKGGK